MNLFEQRLLSQSISIPIWKLYPLPIRRYQNKIFLFGHSYKWLKNSSYLPDCKIGRSSLIGKFLAASSLEPAPERLKVCWGTGRETKEDLKPCNSVLQLKVPLFHLFQWTSLPNCFSFAPFIRWRCKQIICVWLNNKWF